MLWLYFFFEGMFRAYLFQFISHICINAASKFNAYIFGIYIIV